MPLLQIAAGRSSAHPSNMVASHDDGHESIYLQNDKKASTYGE
jgi:hypothetical protein